MKQTRRSEWREKMVAAYFNVGRGAAIALAVSAIIVVAFLDWVIKPNLALGFLYIIPVMMAAGFIRRWEILLMAVGCAVLREEFSSLYWEPDAIPRMAMVVVAYAGSGMFVKEVVRNRHLAITHLDEIRAQIKLRRQAEEQLRALIESSPAAILTADSEGRVLQANEAANRLLGFEGQALTGQPLKPFLPILAEVVRSDTFPAYRTTMQCAARRRSGEVFYAYTWFSTYRSETGRHLAAIVVDASEDLRDREEQNLHQVLTSTRIMVGAVAHEIRNVCGAINVAYANLARSHACVESEDFRALGTLTDALGQLASAELRPAAEHRLAATDLQELIEELKVVSEPAFEEEGVSIEWQIPTDLPMVWADRHGLLQAFMNLSANSRRAMENCPERVLTVSAAAESGRVVVRFSDTGPGIEHPERLFQAFQPGAAATGLGLYVSRAILRSFRGDLRLERNHPCCFAVQLEAAGHNNEEQV